MPDLLLTAAGAFCPEAPPRSLKIIVNKFQEIFICKPENFFTARSQPHNRAAIHARADKS
jgi:hypothetical protein